MTEKTTLDAFRKLAENVRILVCKEYLKAKKGLKTVVKKQWFILDEILT